MKAKCSISIMMAGVALLVFGAPVPVFSQMKDMPMKEHRPSIGYGKNNERNAYYFDGRTVQENEEDYANEYG